MVYSFKATQPTLNNELHSTLGQLRAGLRYIFARRGPLALSVNQFGGFARADPQRERPDVQDADVEPADFPRFVQMTN